MLPYTKPPPNGCISALAFVATADQLCGGILTADIISSPRKMPWTVPLRSAAPMPWMAADSSPSHPSKSPLFLPGGASCPQPPFSQLTFQILSPEELVTRPRCRNEYMPGRRL